MTSLDQIVFGETLSLLRDASTKEAEEFEALVQRTSRLVFRVAYAVTKSRQDADDVTQEAFLKLYRNGAWKRMEDEKAFLARVTWRLALTRSSRCQHESLEPEHEEIATEAASPEENALHRSELVLLKKLIAQLEDNLRQPLVLSALNELNSRQIASVLGIPEGTVRTRLQRARAELKRQFDAMKGGVR